VGRLEKRSRCLENGSCGLWGRRGRIQEPDSFASKTSYNLVLKTRNTCSKVFCCAGFYTAVAAGGMGHLRMSSSLKGGGRGEMTTRFIRCPTKSNDNVVLGEIFGMAHKDEV
jgi:hypothetical protein